MRIVFAGTPDFAALTLTALINANHDVVGVYTQPDRKTGRGQKLTPPPVKVIAQENNIPVKQPISFKNEKDYEELKSMNADLMIVVAYGMLLPQRVLDLPRLACLNIHASLLPRWRGAAPIQRAIEAGDSETGVCIMQMEAGLDTGPVLSEKRIPILANDTAASLHDKLAELGSLAILETLENLEHQLKNAITQNHELACYAHKMIKSEATIDWTKTAIDIQRKIRAFNPWPICQSFHSGQRYRIWYAEVLQQSHNQAPGTIIKLDKTGIQVACAEHVLNILTIQREGSKPLAIHDFINSTRLAQGQLFTTPE